MRLGSLSGPQRRALLGLAHNVIVSDGLLDPGEERAMDELRSDIGLADDISADYIELDGIEAVFPDRHSRIVALLNLIRLGYADGAFEIEEECLLYDVAERFGVDESGFARLDGWVRRFMALESEIDEFVN